MNPSGSNPVGTPSANMPSADRGTHAPRVWLFGDNVTTDAMAPGAYMKLGIAEIAAHCFESTLPAFAKTAGAGDIIVAGRNFGAGSSREQAPAALRHLGITFVLAKSYGGIFYRNAFNLGLPVIVCARADEIRADDRVTVDPEAGRVVIANRGVELACEPVPPHLMAMVRDGGLLPHLKKRFAREQA